MDPLVWATLADFWWIGPAAVGAGAIGWFGLRHQRSERARRLAYEAAKHELREARRRAIVARGAAKIARAELAGAQAQRTASRASTAEVAAARRDLQQTQRDARAAAASVRTARARVSAARAALPKASTPSDELPLPVLFAEHDAITARWIDYETDAAKLLAFPAMSDARQPATAHYLAVRAEAQHLRPRDQKVTPREFVAYRDAVRRLGHAFDAAEREAWRLARADGTAPAGPSPHEQPVVAERWSVVAQQVIARSADSLTRATEAAAAAFESRLSPVHRDADAAPAPTPPASRAPASASPASASDPVPATAPAERDDPDADAGASRVWPVPRRS